MLRRALAAALGLLVLSGFVLAETYRGPIVELTDSQLTVLVRKGEKKVLKVADKVVIVQPKGKEEKQVSLPELQKRITRAKWGRWKGSVLATVNTKGGQVVKITLDASRVPEKVAAILDKTEQIELYSLEPEPDDKAAKNPKAIYFHRWLVLGKTVLKDARGRKQAIDALDESVGRGRRAKCFDPRHGIRATHGGKTVELVICFRCGQVYVYFDGNKEKDATLSINRGTQPVLDAILTKAGIPLAKTAKE
jgi:hypothetical protein